MLVKLTVLALAGLQLASGQFTSNVWTVKAKPAPFSARADHAAIWSTNANKIYMTGGWTGTTKTAFNDVWSSDGGATWIQVNGNASWSGRFGHSLNSVASTLIMTGGEAADEVTVNNEVWTSTNGGITWTQLSNAAWSARTDHAVIYAQLSGPQLIMTGGRTGSSSPALFADTWLASSSNYASWQQYSSNGGWLGRSGHEMVFVPAVEMGTAQVWLMGGSANSFYSSNYFGDTWSTTDGITWTQRGSNSFPARTGFGVAVYPSFGSASVSRVWVVGGSDASFLLNSVYFAVPSVSGYSWMAAEYSTSFEQRVGLTLTLGNIGRMVAIGGLGNPDTITNGSQAITTFNDAYEASPQVGCFLDGRKCSLNGVCNTQSGACSCSTGYSGSQCQTASCTPACQNGGMCTDYNVCTCVYGYTGATCGGSNSTDPNSSSGQELQEEKGVATALGVLSAFMVVGLVVLGYMYWKKGAFTKVPLASTDLEKSEL